MKLAVVGVKNDHTTIINTDQITYLREGVYGTATQFTSGEHIICSQGIGPAVEKLKAPHSVEALLIKADKSPTVGSNRA
ncbi:MAG: hypothetical protein ACKOPM_10410 [Novosphingobium sp.]